MKQQQFDVLVVEDDNEVREILRELLVLEGYSVSLAVDGREALAWLANQLPRVILTDLNMPSLDGWQLLAALRADARLAAIPVLIMTSEEDAPTGYSLLKKPFAVRALLAFVEASCAKSAPATASPEPPVLLRDDAEETSD